LNILVFNCGSSSLNYKIFQADHHGGLKVVCKGKAHRVGVKGSHPSFIEHFWAGERQEKILPIADYATNTCQVCKSLRQNDALRRCIFNNLELPG
jgi:acetate kinase